MVLCAEYVDMAELLKDNMEAERRRTVGRVSHTLVAGNLGGKSQISLVGYTAAVVTSVHPEKNMRAASLPGYHSQRGQEVWGAGMVAV